MGLILEPPDIEQIADALDRCDYAAFHVLVELQRLNLASFVEVDEAIIM